MKLIVLVSSVGSATVYWQ